jgi:hypothetical protein
MKRTEEQRIKFLLSQVPNGREEKEKSTRDAFKDEHIP